MSRTDKDAPSWVQAARSERREARHYGCDQRNNQRWFRRRFLSYQVQEHTQWQWVEHQDPTGPRIEITCELCWYFDLSEIPPAEIRYRGCTCRYVVPTRTAWRYEQVVETVKIPVYAEQVCTLGDHPSTKPMCAWWAPDVTYKRPSNRPARASDHRAERSATRQDLHRIAGEWNTYGEADDDGLARQAGMRKHSGWLD